MHCQFIKHCCLCLDTHCFTNFQTTDVPVQQRHRGVCRYVQNCLHATTVCFPGTSFTEQLWVKIKLKGSDSLYAGCIYRSPSGDSQRSIDDLCDLLRTVCASNPSHLLVAGDFNLPHIDWNLHLCRAPDTNPAHQFLSTVQDLFLFQHVTESTRYRDGVSPSLLDLILTNEEGMITSMDFCPRLGKGDHVMIKQTGCLQLSVQAKQPEVEFQQGKFPGAG